MFIKAQWLLLGILKCITGSFLRSQVRIGKISDCLNTENLLNNWTILRLSKRILDLFISSYRSLPSRPTSWTVFCCICAIYPSTENMTNPARKLVRQLMLLVTMASLWAKKRRYIVLFHGTVSRSFVCLSTSYILTLFMNDWFSEWLS